MSASVVALLCRTSDRTPGGARGAEALAPRLARLLGVEPRMVGSAGDARPGGFADDLRESRGCLLEAGGQVDDALTAGLFPVLLASDCSICITTLPTVLRHNPEARVVWLDAHGDFNTPETTPSGFLGGMCLAAACGRWDAGLGDGVLDPARVVMTGVRDLDGGERVELERAGVGTAPPEQARERARGRGGLRPPRPRRARPERLSLRSSPPPAGSRPRACATCSASSPSRPRR